MSLQGIKNFNFLKAFTHYYKGFKHLFFRYALANNDVQTWWKVEKEGELVDRFPLTWTRENYDVEPNHLLVPDLNISLEDLEFKGILRSCVRKNKDQSFPFHFRVLLLESSDDVMASIGTGHQGIIPFPVGAFNYYHVR